MAALGVAFTIVVQQEPLEQQNAYMSFERLQVTRTDQANLGQSAFGREHDVTTPMGALRALPVGLTYLLFAPFPWAVAGTRHILPKGSLRIRGGRQAALLVGEPISVEGRTLADRDALTEASRRAVAALLERANAAIGE